MAAISLVRLAYPQETADAAVFIVADVCPPSMLCDRFYPFHSLVVVVPHERGALFTFEVVGQTGPEDVMAFVGQIPEHIAALVPPVDALAYPGGCATYELSDRRCAYIVAWAKQRAGIAEADPVDVQLLGDPDCPDPSNGCDHMRTMSFVVRVRLVRPDGSSRDESVFCGVSGQHSLLCTETPVINLHTPISAYRDVPCSGEAPDNPCATPVPTPDANALASAEPLEVDSLSIPIDRVGSYVVEVGQAVLPNGILSEAMFRLRDETPGDFLVAPGGVSLRIVSLDGGEPFENIYAHGWRPGTERVEATLTFTVESFEPGAVLEVLDIVVR